MATDIEATPSVFMINVGYLSANKEYKFKDDHVKNYFQVPLAEFITGTKAQYPLFLKLSDRKFVKIVNKDDINDYCIISVSLSTCKYKENTFVILSLLIQKILQRFPIFQILLKEIL